MKTPLITLLAFAGCTIIISCQSDEELFGPLSKMEGEWSMSFGEGPGSGSIVESWVKVNDTLYSGKSYEVVNGDSTLLETIQLVATQGAIFYIPTTQEQNNRQPVSFRLTKQEGEKSTFENPEHDFPTTITYEFQNDSTLKAAISGIINGEVKGMEFLYIKGH